MKTFQEIQKRLEKLRTRYCRKFCAEIRSKKPHNCIHNVEHVPSRRKADLPIEMEIAPRIVTTLVVIQPDSPIRLCMYGSEKPDLWNGDVCDDDETAKACPYFEAKIEEKAAIEKFNRLMADDAYVMEHYKDIATLQWVLEDRIHRTPLSTWGRFLIWIDRLKLRRKPAQLPQRIEGFENVDAENP